MSLQGYGHNTQSQILNSIGDILIYLQGESSQGQSSEASVLLSILTSALTGQSQSTHINATDQNLGIFGHGTTKQCSLSTNSIVELIMGTSVNNILPENPYILNNIIKNMPPIMAPANNTSQISQILSSLPINITNTTQVLPGMSANISPIKQLQIPPPIIKTG